MRHLRAIIFHKNMIDGWRDSLPLVQRILNASVHSSIGVSPAQLLFGNSINLDRGILFKQNLSTHELTNLSEWTSNMLEKQETLLKLAKSMQEENDEFHIATHNKANSTTAITEYSDNEYVLVNYHNRPPSKFHTNLKGPLRVVSHNGANYTLQDLVSNKTVNVHVSKLSPFDFDKAKTDPRVIANKDNQMFDVEQILSHSGRRQKLSTLTFRVRWRGYGPEDDTTESWKTLKDTVPMHNYLRSIGWSSLIPKKFAVAAELAQQPAMDVDIQN